MNHQRIKRMLFLAIMTAAAIVLHFIEGLFPLPLAIPGIKLGLSNTILLIVLYLYGPVSALVILVLRVLMTSFLYTGFSSVLFGLTGGILSLSAMAGIWKLRAKGFSIVGASVAGGVLHNVGQILAASVVLGTSAVFSYLPVLLVSGTMMGAITGMLARILVPRLDSIYRENRSE